MSDTMLLGVLRMPVRHNDDITLIQFIDRARAAADRIERDAELIEGLQRQNQLQQEQISNMSAMLDQAEAREQALAAHVEALVAWADAYIGTTGLYEEVESARNANTSSLARLKAKWQAEALERADSRMPVTQASSRIIVRKMARELRRQAQGELT